MLMASQIPIAVSATCEGEGRNVRQHAMTEVVRLVVEALIARQVARRVPGIFRLPRIFPPAGRMRRGARPEFDHDMLVVGRNGPLGYHVSRVRRGCDPV